MVAEQLVSPDGQVWTPQSNQSLVFFAERVLTHLPAVAPVHAHGALGHEYVSASAALAGAAEASDSAMGTPASPVTRAKAVGMRRSLPAQPAGHDVFGTDVSPR